MLDYLEILNGVLAIAALFAAAGSLNAMSSGGSHTIRFATLMLFVAGVAHVLSYWLAGWDKYAYTLLYGGAAGLLFGNRRMPYCMLERYAIKIGAAIVAIAGAAVALAILLTPTRAIL